MKKIVDKYRKWNPSIYSTILLLIIPFLAFVLTGFKLDNDFWFLINTGKTIINEGFIQIETFTIHSGLSFIPQQWLTDIIFYFIYSKFDIRGMFYFVIMCNGLIIFLSYKLCNLVCHSRKKTILITIVTNIILFTSNVITTRPQLFDIIIFLLELYLLELYISKNNKKYLYPIPIISILLINYHASMWLMLFVLMIPYFVEYFIQKRNKKDVYKIKPLFIIMVISLLGGLINPYGLQAITYLFSSFGNSNINSLVNEMKPLNIKGFFGIITFIIIFIMLFSFYKNKGNNKIRYFLLSMGVIFLALNHLKAILFLVIMLPLVLGYNFDSKEKETKLKILLYEKVVYVILIIISMGLVVTNVRLSDDVKIKEFADYLDQNANYDIKLFTDYNDGSYMEYRGYKCYIDSRAEVFLKSNNQKEDIFDEYYKLEKNKLDIKEFLDKYNFDYLLVSDRFSVLLRYLQDDNNYQEVYSKTVNANDVEQEFLFENISNKSKK